MVSDCCRIPKKRKKKGEIFYEGKGPRRDGYVEGRTFGIQVISLCFKAMKVMSLDTQLKQRVMDMRHVVMTKTVPGLHRSVWHLLRSPHRCYNTCNSLSLAVSFSVSRCLFLCLSLARRALFRNRGLQQRASQTLINPNRGCKSHSVSFTFLLLFSFAQVGNSP